MSTVLTVLNLSILKLVSKTRDLREKTKKKTIVEKNYSQLKKNKE